MWTGEAAYHFQADGSQRLIRRRATIAIFAALLSLASGIAVAGAIDDRVQAHVEAAVAGGLQADDFHHVFLAFAWRRTFANWTLVQTNLDRLAAVQGADPLMIDELRLTRARIEVENGHTAAARELFRTMGGMSSWWFGGPVPLEELEDFGDVALLPGDDAEWRPVSGTDPMGWVRLSGLAWPPRRQMAYLATTIVSDHEQPVAVRLGAAQVARAWLNGVEVLSTEQPLERSEDQVAGGGWLRKGNNSLIVAVASEDERWWLRVRVTQPDGRALKGAQELGAPPVVEPAVNRTPPKIRDLRSEIELAVSEGAPGSSMALAAYLVAHQPDPVGAGSARTACQTARAESPGEARLLEWIVTTEPRVAQELLSQAVEADPDLLWARLDLADWYGERGLMEEARDVLVGHGGDEPVAKGVVLDLDAVLWGPVVLPELARLGRAWPRCVRVNTILAQRAADARRWDLALQAMVRLEDLVPGMMEVVELRRRLAESCGDGEVLRELFTDLLDRDPNQPEIRVRLARLLGADGDAVAARAVLEEGLERSPGNAVLLMELAGIERLAGRQDRAIELAHEVLAVRPQDRQAQRLLELLGEEGEDFSWMRSPEELWKMADAATPANPAVVLLDHRELHFLPSDLSEERVQMAILITESGRADDLLTRSLPYVAEKEQLRVLRARILRRDGGEISASQSNTPRLAEPEFNLYYDTRLRILRFPEVSDGDVLEIAYILTETEEANETGPYNGGLMLLGQRLTTELVEVEMSGPADRMPAWELAGLEGEPESQMVGGGEIRLRWTWRDLAAIPADVPPAPDLLVTPYLVYSNHPDWGDLADWYQRHVAPRIRASAQVEEVARRLVDGVEGRRDRIDRIYRFVTNDVRYVGLEFGEHRFRPFSADWVLHHKIGDCKDKAALLVALYSAIGVPARMVMVRTADLGPVRTKIAALEFFNHAIDYLPEDDLWLDGTASGHAPYPPPGPDQGAVVLVVDGPTSELETSPVVGGGLSRESYVLRAGEGGLVELEMRSEDTGGAADRRRALFAGSKEKLRVARWLQSVFPGAELTGEPELHLPPGRDPTIIEVRGAVPRAALASAGGVRTFPGDLGWKASSFPGGSRHAPLEMEVRPDLQWTLEVELGRAPSVLAPPVDLETPYGKLRLDFRAQPLGYRVEGFLHLESGLVEAAEYHDLRDFLVAVERHLQRRLEVP